MPAKEKILVYPNGDHSRWLVKKSNNRRASYSFENRPDAEKKARILAKEMSTEMVVRDEDETLIKQVSLKSKSGASALHVRKKGNYWVLNTNNEKSPTHKFFNRKEALKEAEKIAHRHSAVVIIHGENGNIKKVRDMRGIPAPL